MKKTLFFVSFVMLAIDITAQVGIGTTNPDASSALDIVSTDKGVLVPRVSLLNITNSTSPISSPTTGLLVWNSNAAVTGGNGIGFYFWNSSQWQSIASSIDKIDDLSDGKSDNDGSQDGSSIFLGINAGAVDDSTDNKNVGVGFESLSSNTTGEENTAVGYNALKSNIQGSYNSAFGSNALYSNIGSGFLNGGENTAIGAEALYSNTSGGGNTATGASALESNISGDLNSAIGLLALYANISGNNNTATGFEALFYNLASENTANGYKSLYANTTGTGNTGMGSYSLHSNSIGNNNTAVGFEAIGDNFNNNIGNNNTAVGYHALFYPNGSDNIAIGTNALPSPIGSNNIGVGSNSGNSLITGNDNLFIGSNSGFSTAATISGSVFVGNASGYNATNSNRLYIENTNANASNALIYGEFGSDNTITGNVLRTNSQFQIGNPTGSGYAFPTTDGVASQVLQTDGSGAIVWATVGSGDHDWYRENTTTSALDINNDIFTQGNVAIGKNTADYPLDIAFTSAIGINTSVTGTSNTNIYGSYFQSTNTGTGSHYGSYHDLNGTGSGDKYGVFNTIASVAGGIHYGVYSDVLKAGSFAGYFLGNVSVGTTAANTYILPVSRGTANQMMQTDGTGNLSWITPTVGDITGVTAGDGLVNGGTSGAVTLNVVATNGLTDYANDIRLGGTLTETTTISQGTFGMTYNLTGIGDFTVQDAGINHFQISDAGQTFFGDDTFWRDGSTAGTNLAILSDDGDDGRFRIYENGLTSIDFDANTQVIFNEQGLDRNFRIESDSDQYTFFVDAGNNNVGVKTTVPTRNLHLTIDRYAGVGSYGGLEIEQSFNSNAWTLYTSQSSSNLSLYYNNNIRGNFNNVTGVYTNASDIRLKKNIEDIDFSLDKLMQLKPKKYHFNTQNNGESKNPGFIAQDVKKLFPDIVEVLQDDTNGNGLPGLHTIGYSEFIPYIIKGMQEHQTIIEKQQSEIDELKKEINEISALLKM